MLIHTIQDSSIQNEKLKMLLLTTNFKNPAKNFSLNNTNNDLIGKISTPIKNIHIPVAQPTIITDNIVTKDKFAIIIGNAKLGLGYCLQEELEYLFNNKFVTQKDIEQFLKYLNEEYIDKLFYFIIEHTNKIFFDDYSKQLVEDSIYCYSRERTTICGAIVTDIILQLWETLCSDIQAMEEIMVDEQKYQIVLSKLDNLPENEKYGQLIFYSMINVFQYLFYNKKDNKLSPKNRKKPFSLNDCLRLYLLFGEIMNFMEFLDERKIL